MPKTDYFNNAGGLNVTDSPQSVADDQATGGWNYEYDRKGAIVKSRDITAINTVANAQTLTHGNLLHFTTAGTKTVTRQAGTKFQTLNIDAGTFANISEDTAAVNSDFYSASSYVPVTGVNFNTATSSMLWTVGGGATSIYGYSGSLVSKNGADAPTGTLGAVVAPGAGVWTPGTYYYALALRKTTTQSISNAALDVVAVVVNATDVVNLTLPAVDTTKYDKYYLYRSAVSGVTAFTTGTLVAQINTSTTTYQDVGNVSVASAQVVPRSGNTTDNSVLATGTPLAIASFKRRLIVAIGSTIHFSDVNKPESWPLNNNIVIPTGGPITGIGVIGYNSTATGTTDEYLVVFKERETWIVTGSSISDYALKYVDASGCAGAALVVNAGGYITWCGYDAIYLWEGSGKPIRISGLIQGMFNEDGNIDKTKLARGWAQYYAKQNKIVFCISDRVKGENKLLLKLDLRLTSPRVADMVDNRSVDGVFTPGYLTKSLYGGLTYLPTSNSELFLAGDAAGFAYKMFHGFTANGSGIDFQYETKCLDQGSPTEAKRYLKVVAWIDVSVPEDLTLEYWSSYRVRDNDKSYVDESMQQASRSSASVWDLAVWEESLWDDYQTQLKSVVFNLHSRENNNEGECIKLRFKQQSANAPVTIHGFTVYWEPHGLRK